MGSGRTPGEDRECYADHSCRDYGCDGFWACIDADGEILGVYRKTHIPDDHYYQEKFYFTPGDTGFRVFDTRYGKIGVGICWDQWFPETANQELLAFGMANLAAAFTGCCPINGSVSRTTMSEQYGGRTQLTGIFAGVVMIVILVCGTGFIGYLPVPVLTAIVISALYSALEFDLAQLLDQLGNAAAFTAQHQWTKSWKTAAGACWPG